MDRHRLGDGPIPIAYFRRALQVGMLDHAPVYRNAYVGT